MRWVVEREVEMGNSSSSISNSVAPSSQQQQNNDILGDANATKTLKRRDFILHSQGEDSYVEVKSSDTLTDVRNLILQDFDVDQLPPPLNSNDTGKSLFAFRVKAFVYQQSKRDGKMRINC